VDLIAVGDVMLDVRTDAGPLAHGGDVHGRVALQPGGTSANAAVWAAWDGATSRVHARVGDDPVGRVLADALGSRGVEAALAIDPDAPTGTMLVMYEQGERSMVADRGANARLSPADLPDDLEAGAVLVSGYLLLQPGAHDTAVAALERARAAYVAVDAASWPLVQAFGAGRFFDETAAANALFVNDREAWTLTGEEGSAAARALGERYALVAVKLGARGSLLVVEGRLSSSEAERVVEVDPTGAGDAFDGVLLSRLARGEGPEEAHRRAGHVGALVAANESSWPVEPRP
jgi:sugar/nucleoside kinase (ribokinase family)